MIAALIVAAGRGVRMGAPVRKQYLPLGGRSILAHTLRAFDRCEPIERIVLVVPAAEIDFCRLKILDELKLRVPVDWVAGGARRQDSVRRGLEVLLEEGIVLIHDGVRPMVSQRLIQACIQGARQWGACIPVLAVADTLKRVGPRGEVERTVSRDGLCMVQTPQAFGISLIKRAHAEACRLGWEATDDASLVERAGGTVGTVAGTPFNIKITTPDDLRWAEALLSLQGDP